MTTTEQLKQAFTVATAVAETIRELERVSSGELYATLLNVTDKPGYDRLIETLVRCKLVRLDGHDLVWTGPKFEE